MPAAGREEKAMTTPKLTKAQQAVLDELRKPGTRALEMNGIDHYWCISTNHKRCTLQVEALLKLRLLKITKQHWTGDTAEAVR